MGSVVPGCPGPSAGHNVGPKPWDAHSSHGPPLLPVKEASGLRNLSVGEEPEVGTETKCICLCHFPESLGGDQRSSEGRQLCVLERVPSQAL